MNILTLDYETYYASDYTLSALTTEAYIRDDRFKIHMVGLKMNDKPGVWVPEEQIPYIFDKIKWEETAVLMHHAHFDQAITTWRCGVGGKYFTRGALPRFLSDGIRPMFILDTLSMFRALYPAEAASLANMVKVLEVGEKGFEVENTRGKYDLTVEEMKRLGDYCANGQNSDLNLTWRAWLKMKGQFPLSELRLIDMTVRMFTEPALRLDPDMLQEVYEEDRERTLQLFEKAMPHLATSARKAIYEDDAAAWKLLKTPLSSNDQFAAILLGLSIDPPKKISPAVAKKYPDVKPEDAPEGLLPKVKKADADAYETENGEPHPGKIWTYAFGKSDEAFKRLLEHPDPNVVTLVEARLGVKSTIKETRSKRMMGISERGWFPIYLKYYGAHTGRYGGGDKMNAQNFTRSCHHCGGEGKV
jgi:hypothetical protein